MIRGLYRALVPNRTKTMMRLLNLNIPFYQSLEELGITGQRSTKERFEKYGLKTILKPHHKVLDVGCNTGFFSMSVARYVKEVDGIDNKTINILQGRIAQKKLNINNLHLKRTGFEKFTTNKKYDVILSFAIHHWVNMSTEEYVRKLKSNLKNKGLLYFESHNLSTIDQHFDRTIELIKKLGFTVIKKIPMTTDGNRVCVVLQKK